jgi:hypothetical protein
MPIALPLTKFVCRATTEYGGGGDEISPVKKVPVNVAEPVKIVLIVTGGENGPPFTEIETVVLEPEAGIDQLIVASVSADRVLQIPGEVLTQWTK